MAVGSYTVDDLHRMVRAGTLAEDARVELLDGQIVPMTPIGVAHAACVARLTSSFASLSPAHALLWGQSPLHLGTQLPQPDVTLVRPGLDLYRERYPTSRDTFLVVEVADTTLAHDRDRKVPLYAAAAIREVWLVNLPGDCLTVYRRPVNGMYGETRTARRGDTIAPVAFPDLALAVSDILG